MSQPLLSAEGIGVTYGKARAVDDAGLSCPASAVTALLGPNGAGKSSLLHALIGGVRGVSGSVRLAGESLDGLSPNARTARGVSLVPQGRHVFRSLSVEENLAVIADSLRLPRETIGAALDRFPILRTRRKVLAGLLSGGEQQMLAIARALMSGPRVLLLDEPALGLAPSIVDELMATVREVAADGAAVLIAEPSLATLRIDADHGLVMQRGRVVARCAGADLDRTYHDVLGVSV
ncbi:ABC transporter ATP-binding protein [Nocardioides sp. L-11A]|uniref:ABC transporter ATP-binding protein n=1 Tax=Nocardioides sp. L-11A TaxID=3043848 RepID=UPI00249B7F08|nr:ATP-binding cassette domain-containing protein [Nocardioides sp. L-11A]